jgi:hypothetical protein
MLLPLHRLSHVTPLKVPPFSARLLVSLQWLKTFWNLEKSMLANACTEDRREPPVLKAPESPFVLVLLAPAAMLKPCFCVAKIGALLTGHPELVEGFMAFLPDRQRQSNIEMDAAHDSPHDRCAYILDQLYS